MQGNNALLAIISILAISLGVLWTRNELHSLVHSLGSFLLGYHSQESRPPEPRGWRPGDLSVHKTCKLRTEFSTFEHSKFQNCTLVALPPGLSGRAKRGALTKASRLMSRGARTSTCVV
jgi:hypothetical protein